jgi:hypothetical protein
MRDLHNHLGHEANLGRWVPRMGGLWTFQLSGVKKAGSQTIWVTSTTRRAMLAAGFEHPDSAL